MYYSDFRLNIPVKQTVWWWKSKYFNFHEKQPVRFRRGAFGVLVAQPYVFIEGLLDRCSPGNIFPPRYVPIPPSPAKVRYYSWWFSERRRPRRGVLRRARRANCGGRCGERLGCFDVIWSWLREAQGGASGKTWRECTLTASSTLVLYLYLLLCSH